MANAMRLNAILLLACFWTSSSADAQEPRYGPHRSAGNEQVQKLVDELRALTDEADRNRAADPRFLSDLRGLARRYDYPWRVRLISDDFGDGDYTNDPAWTAAAGKFTVACGGADWPSNVSFTRRQLRTSTSHCLGVSLLLAANFRSI